MYKDEYQVASIKYQEARDKNQEPFANRFLCVFAPLRAKEKDTKDKNQEPRDRKQEVRVEKQ
jgi:hypothetical protein